MASDPLGEALVRTRSLLVDLERHVDKGSTERDLAEVARAWVRAAQVERILRSVLPPEAIAEVGEVPEPGHHAGGTHGDEPARRGR